MRLITIGDSITKGTYTAEGEKGPGSIASPNFAEGLKQRLGFDELINYGVNGVSISSNTATLPEQAIVKTIKNMERGDIIVLAAGTNDYGTSVPLGKIEDKGEDTFYGALYLLYDFLKTERANAKVFVVKPIRRQNDGANQAGYTLEDYRNAIEYRAKEFGLAVIDGYSVPIDPKTEEGRKKHILDGLHPNEAGHALYAETLYQAIKKYME